MLTLKVIHLDNLDNKTTHLFAGERISHTEIQYSDFNKEFSSVEQDFFQIGELPNHSDEQSYVISKVMIFDGNDTQKIYILPKSDCFIMANGKTVDVFSSYYK